MFEDDNSDDEPTLEDLFETEDTDPLDDLDALDTSNDKTDTSDAPAATSDEAGADDYPDWADDALDTQSDDDPVETPDSTTETESGTPDLDGQPDEQSPDTVTSASGASTTSDSSLVVSKASLPTNLFSLLSDSSLEWLSTLIWYAKYFVAKIFRIVMTPAIFVVAFFAGAGGWLVFKAVALGIFIAFFKMWLNNPLGMSMTEQYIASAVLIVGFVVSIFADFAVEDYYENNYGT
jgi:hypothetical protein